MLKNYLTIAIRNLIRNKVFSLINIIGLAVGMAINMYSSSKAMIAFMRMQTASIEYLSNTPEAFHHSR
jgi:hypothetical protein